MKKTNTNTYKLLSYNHNTGKTVLYNNKGILAREFSIDRESVVSWFRNVNIINVSLRGEEYTIYEIDQFLIR